MRLTKHLFYTITSIILTLLTNLSLAQVKQTNFNIDYITTKDGLSQSDILDIHQDSFGFVWIATNDGLNRYDGVEFKLFTKGDLGLDSSLPLNICEDKNQNLWISTADRGVFYYLRNENRFVHASQMCDDNDIAKLETTRYVTMGEDNELWFYNRITNNIIHLNYDPKSLKITSSESLPIIQLTYAQCSGLEFIDGELYVCTYWGLLKYSQQNHQIEHFPNFKHTIISVKKHNNRLFVSTPVGLFSYDKETNVKIRLLESLDKLEHICWDGDDLYLSTNYGIFTAKYDCQANDFSDLQQIDSYPFFKINQLKRINTGGIWAGFDKESIRVYQHNNKKFKLLDGFGNNHIIPIQADDKGNILAGTEGSGYFVLNGNNLSNGEKSRYLDGYIVNEIIYSEYYSKYYIATNRGIYKCDEFGNHKLITPITTTKCMIADERYLWVATYSEGLKRIDLETNAIYSFSPSNSALRSDIVRSLILDRDGQLWIATSKGLLTIDAESKIATHPTLTEIMPDVCGDHYIIPLYESRAGDIWYGTLGSGLYRLTHSSDAQRYNIERYSTVNLLPNNTVKAIIEDKSGLIWVSLNSGLCSIDVKNHRSISYDTNNGLLDSEFYDLSAYQISDGTLLFGGASGLTIFNPEDIEISKSHGTPLLTNFEIFNKSIYEYKKHDKITPLALENTKEIRLKYDQNSFIFTFSSLNFAGSKKHQYIYKLEGFDKEWQQAKNNRHEASYTNIPFGRYRFTVRCKNEDGELNPKDLVINVIITPPFWFTWYAILIYIIILAIALFILTKYYQARLLRLNDVKLAKLEKQKIEELLSVRTNFFTNVSHEFRTPLTLILSPLQQLMANKEIMANREWSSHLKTMAFNGESLMRLANDFLNFSKRESRALKLELHLGRFDLLIKKLTKHLSYMANSKDITLCYNSSSEIEFYFDAVHIEQIVYNLTSNAIKHTPQGGKVTITTNDSDKSVTLTVSDSGVGIPAEIQSQIFDRFISRDSIASTPSSGIGIGLSLTRDLVELHNGTITFESEEGKGTTFIVTLPKYSEDSIPTENEIDIKAITETNQAVETTISHNPEPVVEGESTDREVILIVDDNAQLVDLLRSLFCDKYKVISASDGVEGLQIAQSFLPDIIISDVMMPNMDGYELCERIKSGDTTSHIPVILLTAKSSTEDITRGYRHKADGYRVKPFNNSVIIEQVRSLLNNRRILNSRSKQSETSIEVENIGISSEADKQMVKRLIDFVEENISNPDLLVSDVCNAVGLTQVVLNKKLKSLFNMTTNAMIRNIRLKRAAELLRTGRYTVSSITYDVGFNDLRHFRESFFKEYGMFPQAYKKKYNETADDE